MTRGTKPKKFWEKFRFWHLGTSHLNIAIGTVLCYCLFFITIYNIYFTKIAQRLQANRGVSLKVSNDKERKKRVKAQALREELERTRNTEN